MKSNKAIFHKQTDSRHCIRRDLTAIAPCFERVLLQTVDLFRGEQSGSVVKLGQNCADISQTEVGDRLTAELSGQRTEGRSTLSLHASEIEDNDLRQCAC